MAEIKEYFTKHLHDLNRDEILLLNEQDNGSINNVVSNLAEQCFGIMLYDDKEYVEYLLFYISNKNQLNGLAILLSLELDQNTRTSFTIEFSKLICKKYPYKDIVDVFNTLQTQSRTIFERYGYLTLGNDLDDITNGTIAYSSNKGLMIFPTIEKLSLYRWMFQETEHNLISDHSKCKKVYLLLDSKNSLIKIGQSIHPSLREKTLQGINPKWNLIAAWIAPVSEEKRLHKLFKNKHVRGEWFNLNFNDLEKIKDEMKNHKRFKYEIE